MKMMLFVLTQIERFDKVGLYHTENTEETDGRQVWTQTQQL